MSKGMRALSSCLATFAAVACLAVTGCGEEGSSTTGEPAPAVDAPAPAERAESSAELVEVPDLTGESAEDAVATLEGLGFYGSYQEEPDDPSLCTVTDQDELGEVEVETEVFLTLECVVDVPDVTGLGADDAVAELETADLIGSYDVEPDDPALCTVSDQDEAGEAEPGTEVILTLECEEEEEEEEDRSYALPPDDPGDDGYPDDGPEEEDYGGYPPTTEDFGSGKGSVGLCRDGTLSDSIGRPGACSHHGGVAP